jgi:adenosylcobinamide kinase/adenosylcobinamide-phosphate guanylyltransferase
MILVTGGARSGKSGLAERLVERIAEPQRASVLYIATSLIFDDEMAERVAKHRRMRPPHWQTYEGHRDLAALIRRESANYGVILLECVTTMLTNLLFDEAGDSAPETLDFALIEAALNRQVDELLIACGESQCQVVIVTNELGLGIVPENRLARHFRDIAGRVNQRLAAQADEVHFVVSGIDMKIKG